MTFLLDWGVKVVLWFQHFSPALDGFFKALTFTGEEDFFFLLLPIITWGIDRRIGLRLAIVFLMSGFSGAVIKEITDLPRPYQYNAQVRMLYETEGKAFPSLHTQNTAVIWGFLAYQFKQKWLWILTGILFIGVPLSRVYLGLHFPTDLLGGYIFGILILILFLRYDRVIEQKFHNIPLNLQLIIAICAPILIFLISPKGDETISSTTGVVFGAWTGIILERKWVLYKVSGELYKRALAFLLGMAGVMLFRVGIKALFSGLQPESLFRFVRYGFIGIWFTLGAPWVFVKLSLAEVEHNASKVISKDSAIVL